jgi:hypothetical protein
MEHDICINTDEVKAYAAITGSAEPDVRPRLQTHLLLNVFFFATGEDAALLSGSPTFCVALKDANEPSGSVLALLSAPTATGADFYEFEWASIDSPALRTLLGDQSSCEAVLEIKWTISGNVERVSVPVTIGNAWVRSADSAPDPASDEIEDFLSARCVRFDEAQSLSATQKDQALTNLGITNILSINITAAGYLVFTNDAGDTFHIGLNSGSPPA